MPACGRSCPRDAACGVMGGAEWLLVGGAECLLVGGAGCQCSSGMGYSFIANPVKIIEDVSSAYGKLQRCKQ